MLEYDQPRVERDDALILLSCLDSAGRRDEIDGNGQAIVSRVELNPDGEEADQWREVFRKMCDYLLVALADPYVKSVVMIHVGGTRCATSSTDKTMKIQAWITLNVECIRTCIFVFLVDV